MKRVNLFITLFFLSFGYLSAQPTAGLIQFQNAPVPRQHHLEEYTIDKPSKPDEWKAVNKGLNVSFGSIDELYLRSEVPKLKSALQWEKTGWKGERLNAQVVIWAADTTEQIRVSASDLTNEKGDKIASENVGVNTVRYVLSNFPYGAKNTDCGVGLNDSVWLLPDRFEKIDRFDLPGNSVRSVWLTFEIPQDASPGIYTGNINVNSEKEQKTLNVRIRVQDQILPKPKDWSYRLDLWQNPWVVAWYFQIEPWSDEHKALLKKHLQLYADAGGKYITTYAVHSPWSDNSYMIEGTMIDWLKRTDGTWKFDYKIFDEYVELAMEAGIDEAITIYTPVPWGHRFRYMDEKTGNYVHAEWAPDTQEFRNVWKVFLDDLHAHLKGKGWLEKTYLGINENPLDVTIAAAKFIKEHSKDWRITYAGNWHPELTALLDDYSPIIESEPSKKDLAERKAKGFSTTYYVCCTPAKPNNFVFSPPVEGTFISWYAASHGYDGFLRWAYDAWPQDPLRDARHTLWPAGDCFLVYPGGGSSIRFERLREGIVDFEKIRIIREQAGKSTDKKIQKSLKDFETHLATMSAERDYKKRNFDFKYLQQSVTKGKQMLEALSDNLSSTK